jgi:hypothetical protein
MFLKGLFEDPSTYIKRSFGLFDDPNEGQQPDGSAAGAGSGGDGSQAQAGEGDQAGAGQRAASDTRRTDDQGHMIPKHRFDEVNTRYNAYKGFGSPDDVKAKLARLAELEQQPQNRYNDKQQKEIRQDLLRVMPELEGVLRNAEVATRSYTSYGVRQNETFLKELGIEVNEKNNKYLQELIGGVITSDPALLDRFFAHDRDLFKEAFQQVKATFWPNLKRTAPGLEAANRKATPKPGANAGNGTPAKPAGNKPAPSGPLADREIMDQASEDAFARISQQME